MRRRNVGLVVSLVGAMVVVGCGLDVVGTFVDPGPDASFDAASDGATADVAVSPDDASAATDADADAAPGCSCAVPAPDGWVAVAYGDRSSACTGDLATDDLVTEPAASSEACSCDPCSITTMPSCNTGNFSTDYDDNGTPSCTLNASNPHAASGLCDPSDGSTKAHARIEAPNPSGAGACTAPTVAHPEKASRKSVRVCTAVASGTSCACDAKLAPSFKACFRHAGDIGCTDAAYTKHLVAKDVNVTCGGCGCALTNASCSAKVAFYTDGACATTPFVVVGDTCGAGGNGTMFHSLKYTGTPSASCAAAPASVSSVALASPDTVCCP